ncbi:MAG: chromosome segregation protein SMC, partial [Planctomycetes bacterium]|nr:chromosome segregation protein SMC [Planctomycetota bacterium]
MQLKSLELFGFKSFANRTRFDFGPGVTVIVGPNGCGKSNVVDSLKWVLGEQSAKSLRGSEMMDVIFNGSGARKAQGFAEVSLTFRDCRGALHAELDEVKITRKLYRSGESEYQINREVCRLKDIRELFMDTGVGMKAYSIIEQGRIDALLQASSLERRAIFDEAAGISKYKARKKEAERRLERAEQNLVVIDATLEEVGKRLRSLKVQAGRARKFIEYRDELRKRKIAQSLHRYHGLRQEKMRVSGDLVLAETEKEGIDAGFSRLEADLSDMTLRLHEHEEKHRQSAGEADRLDQQIRAGTKRGSDLAAFLRDVEGESQRLQVQRTASLEQVEKFRKDLAAAEAAGALVRADAERLAGRMRESEALLEGLAASLAALDGRIAGLKEEALGNEAAQAAERTSIGRVEEALGSLGRERAGREATLAKVDLQHGQTLEALAKAEREIADLTAALGGLKRTNQEVQKRLAELQERQKALEARATGLAERKIALESRLDVLRKLHERLEGIGEGASRIVRDAARADGALPGIRGLLPDRLEVAPRLVRAIEAALGAFEEAVVADDLEAALGAVESLRDGNQGRASVVPRRATPPAAAPDPAEWGYPGVAGRAADLVGAAPEDRPWVERILGRTLVVESLDVGLGLSGALGAAWTFVTLEGERLEPGSVLTGGVARKGRLARAAEIEDLERDIVRTARETEEARREKDDLQRIVGGVEEQAKNLRNEINDRSHDLLSAQKEQKAHAEAA